VKEDKMTRRPIKLTETITLDRTAAYWSCFCFALGSAMLGADFVAGLACGLMFAIDASE